MPDEKRESLGSYYIIKDKTKAGWRLIRESYINGKRFQKTVPAEEWPALGFHHFMSIDEARQRCREVNRSRSYERELKREALKKAYRERNIESVFLPKTLVDEFTEYLVENQTGSRKHIEKIIYHWKTVQEIIRDLEIDPTEYHLKSKLIYSYFITKRYSLDYSNKLIRMLNTWGQWYTFKQSKPFLPIKAPRGNDKEKIVDASAENRHRRQAAIPMRVEYLTQLKPYIEESHFNWIYISFYFGLRPTEVEQLHHPKDPWTFQIHDIVSNGKGIRVLAVYQSKLVAKPRDKRWKYIPVILPEQERALDIIRSGRFQRPRLRQLKAIIEGIGLYSGRKGFKNLMQEKGQSLENISKWLGHSTTKITEMHYDDLYSVHFDNVVNTPRIKIK